MVPGLVYQGQDEEIHYLVTTPASEGAPLEEPVVVTVLDTTTGEDVTESMLADGEPQISGQDILLPGLSGTLDGHVYRLEVRYRVSAGSLLEPYVMIEGQL